jgi:L-serine dehydratase
MTATPSIFNDVIGPVMRGSSSSHCAAALRIGRLARDLMQGHITDVLVEFDRAGSLPTTHESQGSDMGLCGGLMGWEAADARLPEAVEILRASGTGVRFETVDAGDPHPNTYRLTLTNARERRTLIAISTGGGMMEVINVDGFGVSMGGDAFETLGFLDAASGGALVADAAVADRLRARLGADEVRVHAGRAGALVRVRGAGFVADEAFLSALEDAGAAASAVTVRRLGPVLPVLTPAGMSVPFVSAEELVRHDAGRGRPLWQWAVEYEQARGALAADDVIARMVEIVRLLRRSIGQGIEGTQYEDRILGHQSGTFAARMAEGRLLPGGALNRAILYVSALMEVKSAMGVIVAAPTAGACAALPASVIAVAEERGQTEEDMARALLAAGLIGVFITSQWTFAAEVGGCQAEGGSAAAMAAAALVTLADGSLPQALAASSLAMQSMLGLICDPVAARVEVPCLGKNVLAASHAFSCANLALSDFDPVIPFDEVVHAAARVADLMPREHRCTALGGLATTPTAVTLSAELERRLRSLQAPRVSRP